MPYAPHTRITALGRIGSSGERWQWHLSYDIDSVYTLDLTIGAELRSYIAAKISAYHVLSGISPKAVLEAVKFAYIGTDGKYTREPDLEDVVDVSGGGDDEPHILPQSALAISLETDRYGPTGKGRFFLPMPTGFRGDDMLMPVAQAETYRNNAASLLNDLNNPNGIDVGNPRVVVASSKGYLSDVTGVRVGRVIDTVRSRRRQLAENYTAEVPVS